MKHFVYRHFDCDDVLLYVGVSLSAVHRLGQHKTHSHWFDSIARLTITAYGTREEAIRAERQAILSEQPKHNIYGRAHARAEEFAAANQRADESRDELTESVVGFYAIYTLQELSQILPLQRRHLLAYMDQGKLGYFELLNATGTKVKRYVSGWQLIDFIEWLERQRVAKKSA